MMTRRAVSSDIFSFACTIYEVLVLWSLFTYLCALYDYPTTPMKGTVIRKIARNYPGVKGADPLDRPTASELEASLRKIYQPHSKNDS